MLRFCDRNVYKIYKANGGKNHGSLNGKKHSKELYVRERVRVRENVINRITWSRTLICLIKVEIVCSFIHMTDCSRIISIAIRMYAHTFDIIESFWEPEWRKERLGEREREKKGSKHYTNRLFYWNAGMRIDTFIPFLFFSSNHNFVVISPLSIALNWKKHTVSVWIWVSHVHHSIKRDTRCYGIKTVRKYL